MPKVCIGALVLVLLGSAGFAQDLPALNVTPSTATVLVGQSRPFRAVNRDGRPSSVRWDSSSPDATISGSGSEIMVTFKRPGDFEVHAFSGEGSGSATIHAIAAASLPAGTAEWSLHPFSGCHMKRTVPAVPKAGSTTGLFVEEDCAKGELVLGLTSQGLENWQKWISGGDAAQGNEPADTTESTELLHGSLCDGVKAGMSRDDAMKLVTKAKLEETGFDKSSDLWSFEEGTGECRIMFHDNKVVKKQKVIGN